MSKKVLNYAGRRPMLLALIVMTTFTLGLLFSGWLTPTHGRAQPNQPNPPSNQETTNNCPNYVTNPPQVNCPIITNGESLGPLTFCVELGNSLPDPSWVGQPGAIPGSIVTSVTETCSNITTYATNPVSYSFSWSYQNPPGKPPKPTSAGIYQATAIGAITSSDTSDCPNPSAPTWTVAWNVINPEIIASTAPYTWVSDFAANFTTVAQSFLKWPMTFNLTPITSSDTTTFQSYCCGNQSGSVSAEIEEVNTGTESVNIDMGSTSIKDMAISAINNMLDVLPGYQVPGLAKDITDYCDANGNFSAGSLTASIGANFDKLVSYNDTCNCSGQSSPPWAGSDKVSLTCDIGTVQIPASEFQKFGVDSQGCDLNISALHANLSYDIEGSFNYVGPSASSYQNIITTSKYSIISTSISFGTLYGPYYVPWSQSEGFANTTSITNQVCEGNFYPSF